MVAVWLFILLFNCKLGVVTLSCPFSVRCSQVDGNGVPVKRTVLHDLYEKEGQSPWYDNLCRPITDLLPLIASGVRGVTSNPAVIMHIVFAIVLVFVLPLLLLISDIMKCMENGVS